MGNLIDIYAETPNHRTRFYDRMKPYKLAIQIVTATVALFAVGQLIFGQMSFWYNVLLIVVSYFLAAGSPTFYACMTKDRVRDGVTFGDALICAMIAAVYFIAPMLFAAMSFLVVLGITLGTRKLFVWIKRRLFTRDVTIDS